MGQQEIKIRRASDNEERAFLFGDTKAISDWLGNSDGFIVSIDTSIGLIVEHTACNQRKWDNRN